MSNSIAEIKSEIISAQKSGDYLREYDLAQAALKISPDEEFFKYCSVLALSRCNAKQRALDIFYSYKLHLSENQYVRALESRIMKDLAFQELQSGVQLTGRDRERFSTAAVTYHREFIATGSHYSAINAATLYLFAGGPDRAQEMANSAIEMSLSDEGLRYYPLVTQAEAYLLKGMPDKAKQYIEEAAKYNENNLQTRARTHNQLKLVCNYLGVSTDILESLLPETVIHYCGHIFDQHRPLDEREGRELADRIEKVIADRHCAVAYGSLAAGADIMLAEAILRSGSELNVWLPFGRESFCDEMVRPYGEDWVSRFNDCMEKARTVSYATESDFLGESSLFNFCSDVAMGMAIMRAHSLNARVMQIAVWDQVEINQRSGTYTNVAKWKAMGHPSEVIQAPQRLPEPISRKHHGKYPGNRREPHAILFADVRGYSKLSDQEVLWYFNELQPAMAKVINEHRAEVQHLDTWGDAIFLVTEKASTAARIAIELNKAISEIDQSSLSLIEPLLLRIGLHYGPVYKLYDHLTRDFTYSSNEVTKTARIEPVTPPGEIFGTEPFVAILELEGEGWASFEYAGTISSAKNYGAFRMFHVRPKYEPNAMLGTL